MDEADGDAGDLDEAEPGQARGTALERLRAEMARPVLTDGPAVRGAFGAGSDTSASLGAVTGTSAGAASAYGVLAPGAYPPGALGLIAGQPALSAVSRIGVATTLLGPKVDVPGLAGALGEAVRGLPAQASLTGVNAVVRTMGVELASMSGIPAQMAGTRLLADAVRALGTLDTPRTVPAHLYLESLTKVTAAAAGSGLLGVTRDADALLHANARYLSTLTRGTRLPGALEALETGVAGVTAAGGLLDLDRASRRRHWPEGGDPAERRAAARGTATVLWETTEEGLLVPWFAGTAVRRRLATALGRLGRGADAALATAHDLLTGDTPFLASSVANALTEALDRTLRAHEESDVLAWHETHPIAGDVHEGRPTRRLRARYWLRDADEATQEVSMLTVDYAVGLVRQLQRLKHAETTQRRTLQTLAAAVEAALVALVLDD